MHAVEDTIAAAASPPGGAARGIIRISGREALRCLAGLVAIDEQALDRQSAQRLGGSIRLDGFASAVPCEAWVWPDRRSYTREPTAELHLPGSPPIVEATLAAACRHGVRPARPGEFTLRAFLAGRLDLTQAEAVLGVVDAVDRRHLDTALKQMAGGLAGPLDRLRNDLLDLTAHLEAGLDFVEEDIEFVTRNELQLGLRNARRTVDELLEQMTSRSAANDVVSVVLVGRPNAGKSSLFNALAAEARALVSSVSGTTRDYLTARLVLCGAECELIDTAGVESVDDVAPTIASAAQTITAERRRTADVRLLCLDSSRMPDAWESAEQRKPDPHRIVVYTKADLATARPAADGIAVSTLDGRGLDALRQAVAASVAEVTQHAGDVVAATAVRCRDSLERALVALNGAASLVERKAGEELVAVELRLALDELGQVVGAVYTDDILDRIFSRFCIGK